MLLRKGICNNSDFTSNLFHNSWTIIFLACDKAHRIRNVVYVAFYVIFATFLREEAGRLIDIFPRNCESNETLSKQKQSPRRLYDQNRRSSICGETTGSYCTPDHRWKCHPVSRNVSAVALPRIRRSSDSTTVTAITAIAMAKERLVKGKRREDREWGWWRGRGEKARRKKQERG